ncbi:MAG: MBL fold metallo-hydrolase [Planctomycetes bacterium]|jgi:glyoxylase-like metal-dependent hydrolase (beta-lactamase superfamily II)|nr:MBL fold metallo-hydrolase [Planctomycetota bacterium]MCP4839645.1 MBL fold metallo-hydrolase [Planctomycetota bacterium]
MIPTARVISIGALPAHPLWNESTPVRTGHATTTLVQGDAINLIVDPGLPPQIVSAKLAERAPIKPAEVTHVFLTSFTDDTMRGIAAFPTATWLAFNMEIAAAQAALREALQFAEENPEDGGVRPLQDRLSILDRVLPAEDTIASGVDIFPLSGVTPGTCGLLLAQPRHTVLITGDAVATQEHLSDAKILPTCWDREKSQESFREAIEIADIIIPGRDNLLLNT